MEQIGEHPGTRSGTNIKILSDEGQVRNVQTGISLQLQFDSVGLGSNSWAGLAHEIAHEMGLIDLYRYRPYEGESESAFSQSFFRHFDLMFYPGRPAPELLAWNRWLLGFIEDSEVICLDVDHLGTVAVGPLQSSAQHRKMIVIRHSDSTATIIEFRRALGYDIGLSLRTEGLVIYELNTQWPTGHGAFGLVTKSGANSTDVADAIIRQGDSVTVSGFKIENLDQSSDRVAVRITR